MIVANSMLVLPDVDWFPPVRPAPRRVEPSDPSPPAWCRFKHLQSTPRAGPVPRAPTPFTGEASPTFVEFHPNGGRVASGRVAGHRALKDRARRWTFRGVSVPGLQAMAGGGGSRARLETLFAEHAAAVYAYARRRTTAAEADEIVSETFLVAWRRIDDVPENARPWLLGVARNALLNRRRGDARRAALVVRVAASEPTGLEHETADDGARVRAALDTLPPGERDALTLIAWDDLTPSEAAVVLGCSRSAIYIRLHRARRKLARVLAEGSPS